MRVPIRADSENRAPSPNTAAVTCSAASTRQVPHIMARGKKRALLAVASPTRCGTTASRAISAKATDTKNAAGPSQSR